MKLRKIMLLFVVAIGLTTLMSTQCETEDPIPGCSGIATATTTGNVEVSLCFDEKIHFNYEDGDLIYFVANQNGDPIYSITIDVNTYAPDGISGLLKPGNYNCGSDDVGYVGLVVHGDEDGFFNSKSGTITITEMSETTFKATFNVIAEEFYSHETINLSGTVDLK